MAYLQPMGAVDASKYILVGGVIKPRDADTLAVFKGMQRQINRVASVTGVATIDDDGAIGPGTLAAANKIYRALGITDLFTSISVLAQYADAVTSIMRTNADAKGAAAVVPYKPSAVAAAIKTLLPSGPAIYGGAGPGMSGTTKIAIALAGATALVATGVIPMGKRR